MRRNNKKWKEEAWEEFLVKFWDSRRKDIDIIQYSKNDLENILKKYSKSGQGEIRTFHYGYENTQPVKARKVKKIPITRTTWLLTKADEKIFFEKPDNEKFIEKELLTEGMMKGIKNTFSLTSHPGETTLLAIANHIGIISDFYNLEANGVLFTGGRQSAGITINIGGIEIDISKAQIEIDGAFEWRDNIVVVEMKSTFSNLNFDINQALIPFLKWKKIMPNKKTHALVLLAETNKKCLEYRAYDLVLKGNTGMSIKKSQSYKISF